MAVTKVSISNRAMAAVGSVEKVKIATYDEDSVNARVIRRFYDLTLDTFLEEHEWSFATRYHSMSQDGTDPVENWAYTYNRPADFIASRRIVGSTPEEHIPFEEGMASSGLPVIWADKTNAVLEYTARVENYNAWSPTAVKAFVLMLATDIAPAVSGGDKRMIALSRQYEIALAKAKVASFNRQERREEPDDPFTEARFGVDPRPTSWIKTRAR